MNDLLHPEIIDDIFPEGTKMKMVLFWNFLKKQSLNHDHFMFWLTCVPRNHILSSNTLVFLDKQIKEDCVYSSVAEEIIEWANGKFDYDGIAPKKINKTIQNFFEGCFNLDFMQVIEERRDESNS